MGKMYMGTRDLMLWVPAPATPIPNRGLRAWESSSEFLNGGASVRGSNGGHRVYEMDWSLKPSDVIDPIHAIANGDYGDDLVYFLDPFAMKTNVMPDAWASPWKACTDGVNLAGQDANRPALEDTPQPNPYVYPIKSAEYTLTGSETPRELWIPIPDGYTLHIGAHGSATGSAAVRVLADGGSPNNLTLLTMGATRTNYTVAGPGGLTISLTGTGVLTLTAIIAQVRPTGESVPNGNWHTGQGNSGCRFLGKTEDLGYNAALDFQGASATLVEVGAWLRQ